MLTVTKKQLWAYLSNGGPDFDSRDAFVNEAIEIDGNLIDQTTFDGLKTCDIKSIIAGQEMSENHLGGDDIVSVAESIVAAINEGYAVATWYGPDSQALVVGYRPDQLTVTD